MVRAIFLHHSVGLNILEDGGVRLMLAKAAPDLALWDHGYNEQGLRDAAGKTTGQNYNIPADDTTPIGYATLFSQEVTSPPQNALSHLLEYDVIIFKSCFPVSSIKSEAQLEEYKICYRKIRQTIDNHPDKLFIYFTPPPQTIAETNLEEARRARVLATWLKSGEFSAKAANLAIFDLYSLLADNNPKSSRYGMLQSEFVRQGLRFWKPTHDSHPNEKANQFVAPKLVAFLAENISKFQFSPQPATKI